MATDDLIVHFLRELLTDFKRKFCLSSYIGHNLVVYYIKYDDYRKGRFFSMSTSKKTVPPQKTERSAGQPPKKKARVHPLVIVLPVVAVVVTVVAILVASNWDDFQQLAADRETVAVCNGYEIPYEELKFVTTYYKSQLAAVYGEKIWDDPATAEAHRAELEKLVKENLNQNYVVLSACKQLGIDTEKKSIDNYVDEQVKELRDSYDSKKEYNEALLEQGMTEHYLRFIFSIGYLESAVHYTLLDNDLYAYRYEDNASEYMDYVLESGKYVRTLHVFIENVEGEDPAANLKKAQEVSDKLQAAAAGDERRNLLSEYIGSALNDDLLTVTGDGYYFTRGEMVEAYENAAFDLAIGEVSEPVVCSGGNFVIMRLEPEEEYVRNNVKTLMDAYYGVCLDEYIERFRPNCEVFYTEYGKTLDLLALE